MLHMSKLDKNNASNGLILGHEVLQKSSKFFQKDFELALDPKIELEEGSIPRQFPGESGHQNSSLREAQVSTYLLLQ